jgi:hypothetical protein
MKFDPWNTTYIKAAVLFEELEYFVWKDIFSLRLLRDIALHCACTWLFAC